MFGATVLRRRATVASVWEHPDLPVEFPSSSSWPDRVKRPAHYGFHATIKAPFELREGQTIDQLQSDLASFCASQKPIPLTGLAPIRTTRYDALAFEKQPEQLWEMAANCVERFEKYRAPLSNADIRRRDPSSLTTRQNKYLDQFGYPYILDDFNFHMTLSGTNDHNDADYLQWLATLYEAMVKQTPVLDRLCIFYQPDRETSFVRTSEYCFQNNS